MKLNDDLSKSNARVDGLHSFETPDLDTIENRRLQLWTVALLLLVSLAAALGLVAAWGQIILPPGINPAEICACLIGLAVLFSAYALEKEVQLGALTRRLIAEKMLTTALTSRLREANVLLEAGRAVNRGLELGDVLDTILSCAVELLEGRDGSIMLVRSENELRTVCTTDQSAARGATVRFNESISGKVAATREPLLVSGSIEWDHYQQTATPQPESAISVPLVHRESLLGVLNINAEPQRTYTEHDLRALSLFGEHAAAAIANAQLYETQRVIASQTAFQALHDPLTGLPNRNLLSDRISTAMARHRRDGRGVGLLFVDLDNFKRVNDSLGHAAGDKVLVAVAQRLKSVIRESDTAARYGGDEFAVLLDGAGTGKEAVGTASRLQEALAEPIIVDDRKLRFSLSVGIALDSSPDGSPDELLRNALTALHEAKAHGKGQIVRFETSMHSEALRQLHVEEGLGSAIEDERLRLYFQPILTLDTHRLVGLEALLRWQHPTLGLLPAASFIPVAERTGLMLAIDRWVIERACDASRTLDSFSAASPPYAVHVNVSPASLQGSEIVDTVSRCLDESEFPANRLVIEITENVFLEESAQVSSRLAALRSLGVRLALDDFGTGYSSLSYLRRFPVDVLKIDKLFTEGLAHDHGAPALVEAIVSLGAGLAFDIIAEGVEDETQALRLLDLGCRLGQGFHLARPMSVEDLREFISASPCASGPAPRLS